MVHGIISNNNKYLLKIDNIKKSLNYKYCSNDLDKPIEFSSEIKKYKNILQSYENKFKKLRKHWKNYTYYECNFFKNNYKNNIFNENHIKKCHESFIEKLDFFQNKFFIINLINRKCFHNPFTLSVKRFIFPKNKFILIFTDHFIANGFIKNSFYSKKYIFLNQFNYSEIFLPFEFNGFFEIYYIKGPLKGYLYNGEIKNGKANIRGGIEHINGIFESLEWKNGEKSIDKYLYKHNLQTGKYHIIILNIKFQLVIKRFKKFIKSSFVNV